jgi:phosphohistidine phosphatase
MPGPYELYLIRHGLAEERGPDWPDDTKRPLTREGISRLRSAAQGLEHLGIEFDVMLTSPLVRARQTADAMADAYGSSPSIVEIDSLAPGGRYESLLRDLGKHARRRRIALVGHEPGIGAFAARLAGVRQPLAFKKGAIARIDVETLPPGDGSLCWFVTPKILRSLRR